MISFNVGDTFTATADWEEKIDNYSSRMKKIEAGTDVEIIRVGKKKVHVRCKHFTGYSQWEGATWFSLEGIQSIAGKIESDPEREMGTMPIEGEHISPEHPGLEWLWEDLIRYAKRNKMTAQIDKMTDALGIPGRSRVFKAVAIINGLEMNSDIEARSQKEANKKLKDWIVDNA